MLFTTDTKNYVGHIEFREAAAFVDANHRHNKAPIGHKFSLGLWINGELRGVAIVGRPVCRHYNKFLEIYRNCVLQGTPNGCSMLYGACLRRIKKMNKQLSKQGIDLIKKVITYTLMSENGASVKASNFILEAENCGGKNWTGQRKYVCQSNELKRRWVYFIS